MDKFTMIEENPHTMRVFKDSDKDVWVAECETCPFREESSSRELAYKDMGYHFGRLSTKIWKYGQFLGEE
jgi:hypothetical protein